MPDSRTKAHEALRPLWEAAETYLANATDATEYRLPQSDVLVCEAETEMGARIKKLGDFLMVSAEFDKLDGTDEIIVVNFANDIRDLSQSEVEINWSNDKGCGTNTPKLKDYPKLAKELLSLIPTSV